MAKTSVKLASAPDPKAIWAAPLAAEDPRTLYLALIAAFMNAAVSKAPDGTPWRQISVNLGSEIHMVGGVKSYSLNEAYRKIAEAKGWEGDDANPTTVCNVLIAENAIRGGWYSYPKKSGHGSVRAFKVALNDPNYVRQPKADGKSLSDFGA